MLRAAAHTSEVRAARSLALSLLLPLTAATAATAKPATSGYVLEGMPLIRQTYNACGPASITQVLGYFGLNVSMADVSRHTRPSDTAYMTAQAIVNFAPLVGMQARLYSGGTLDTVRAAMKNGLPLIALQSHITGAGKVIPHWRVIAGYNDATQQVYLMDPLLGYVAMGYSDFQYVWKDHRGQFAVLYPLRLAATVKNVIG